jgi:hypothetical protein
MIVLILSDMQGCRGGVPVQLSDYKILLFGDAAFSFDSKATARSSSRRSASMSRRLERSCVRDHAETRQRSGGVGP